MGGGLGLDLGAEEEVVVVVEVGVEEEELGLEGGRWEEWTRRGLLLCFQGWFAACPINRLILLRSSSNECRNRMGRQ